MTQHEAHAVNVLLHYILGIPCQTGNYEEPEAKAAAVLLATRAYLAQNHGLGGANIVAAWENHVPPLKLLPNKPTT